jgi:hypothetical protein
VKINPAAKPAIAKVRALAAVAVPLAEPGQAPGKKEGKGGKAKGDNITLTPRGTNADYLTARIARDHPDILAGMKAGEYKSVRAAAIEAVQRLKAERDENVCRVDFNPEEAVGMGEAIEAVERPKAQERVQAAPEGKRTGRPKSGRKSFPSTSKPPRDESARTSCEKSSSLFRTRRKRRKRRAGKKAVETKKAKPLKNAR